MGAWDFGPFDNDECADFLDGLGETCGATVNGSDVLVGPVDHDAVGEGLRVASLLASTVTPTMFADAFGFEAYGIAGLVAVTARRPNAEFSAADAYLARSTRWDAMLCRDTAEMLVPDAIANCDLLLTSEPWLSMWSDRRIIEGVIRGVRSILVDVS